MSNIISLLALFSAIMLPVIVVLLSDLDHGLRLDRHLIITRVLKLQWLTFAAVATAVLLFFGIALEIDGDAGFQAALYVFAVIYIMIVAGSMISAVSWLASVDFSSHWRKHPYREQRRLDYLCQRNRRHGAMLWEEFWLDEQTYRYLGAEHLEPYLKAFLTYLATDRPRQQAHMSIVAKSFLTVLPKIYRLDGGDQLGKELLTELLRRFEMSCLADDKQQELWAELISGYMSTMRLAPSAAEEALETDEYPYSAWQSAFGYCFAVSPVVRDHSAIKELAEVLRRHYREGVADIAEQKRYLVSIRRQAPSGHKKFYRALAGSLSDSGGNNLVSYLIARAERPEAK